MTRDAEIRARLEAAFAPTALEVINESARHAHHAGHEGSAGQGSAGQSHYRVRISAPAFAGMNRIERHRAVHAALGKDLTQAIHALALDITG